MKCACGSLIKSYEYMCTACFLKEEGKTTKAVEKNYFDKSQYYAVSVFDCTIIHQGTVYKLTDPKFMCDGYSIREKICNILESNSMLRGFFQIYMKLLRNGM